MLLPFLHKENWGTPNGKTQATRFARARGDDTSTAYGWQFTTVKFCDEPHYGIFAKSAPRTRRHVVNGLVPTFDQAAANGSSEPIAEGAIFRCVCSQSGTFRTCKISCVATRQKMRSFTRGAAEIRWPRIKSRTKPTFPLRI